MCFLLYTQKEEKEPGLFLREEQRKKRKENIMMVMSFDELKKLPPLTEDDIRIIENARPLPSDDCPELSESELKQFRPWYDREKQPVTIDIDISIINYYKRLSVDTGVPYQDLMNMFLVQCAKEEKKPVFA